MQREIEAAGISTITLTPIPVFTAWAGAPRVAAIEYPLGLPFGMPGDKDWQMVILRATLQALTTIDRPGGIEHLPFTWPEELAEITTEPLEPPPLVSALIRRPWQFRRLLARDIPE